MFGFRKRDRDASLSPYEVATRSSYEGHGSLRVLAMAAAVGLSVSVMFVPHRIAFAAAPEEPAAVQAAARTELDRLNALFPLSHAKVTEETASLTAVFRTPTVLAPATDFHAYISAPSLTEVNEKLEEIRVQKEREERAKALQAARIAQQQATIRQGGYVRFNRQGIPLSQKPGAVELDANGVPTHYSYCITGTATAYYGGTSTSIGAVPMQGTVAVNPRQIPYGTRMWIVTSDGSGVVYGLGVAEDTGGFIYLSRGPVIDVYMNSYEDCVNWGLRTVNIYILD